MGIGVVLLLHLILYAALAAALSFVARLIQSVLPPSRPTIARALRISPFVIAGMPLAMFVASLVWAKVAPPSYLYRSVFGIPGAAVELLRGESDATNDSDEVFLSFAGSDAALQEVLSTASFQGVGAAAYGELVPMPGTDPPPSWWVAGHCPERSVFFVRNVRGWDQIVVTYCRSAQTIYVQARWIH
jgi:hypothetical protein